MNIPTCDSRQHITKTNTVLVLSSLTSLYVLYLFIHINFRFSLTLILHIVLVVKYMSRACVFMMFILFALFQDMI